MSNELISVVASVVLGAFSGFLTAIFYMGKYQQKIDTLEGKVNTLEKEHKEVTQKLTEVGTKLDERTQSYAATLTKRKSPISLTDKGEDLLSRSGANKFVLENQEEFVKKIKDKEPKSAYDVQINAREVIESLQNEDRFVRFKDFVYKEGIELETIFIVMSIYLRDIALPLLGYTKEEVDRSDPKKENDGKTAST